MARAWFVVRNFGTGARCGQIWTNECDGKAEACERHWLKTETKMSVVEKRRAGLGGEMLIKVLARMQRK